MPSPDPPSLCSTCGRDLRPTEPACVCLGVVEAWLGGERTGLVGRQWRTVGGAEATTFFGRLYAARGHGRVSFAQLVPPHYGALRGDLVYGLRPSGVLRDPPVDALLAALLGGAGRGTIQLRGVRQITWSRKGRHRGMESAQRGFDDVSVSASSAPAPDEDQVLSALLFPPPRSRDLSAYGYRGDHGSNGRNAAQHAPLGVAELLARAVPNDDVPECWIAAMGTVRMASSVAERTHALLAEVWRDERHRDLVEELTRHLRFALRPALASRGATG